MNIVFIGFMGAGKSFFANRLVERLGLKNFKMDELVLNKSCRNSIKEIFEKDGEIRFRELEIEVAKELQKQKNVVIDTGGGVVLNKIILDYLRKDGIVVFLNSSLQTIEKRLKGDTTRPLFKNKKKFRQLYKQRMSLYKQYGDIEIDTDELVFFSVDGKSHEMLPEAEKILQNIIKKIKVYNKSSTFKVLDKKTKYANSKN